MIINCEEIKRKIEKAPGPENWRARKLVRWEKEGVVHEDKDSNMGRSGQFPFGPSRFCTTAGATLPQP